jgi:hypothetical protein
LLALLEHLDNDSPVSSSATSLRSVIAQHPGWWITYVLLVVLSLSIAALGGVGVVWELELTRDGVTTCAPVVERRSGTQRGRLIFEVRYELRLSGDPRVYSHGDETGRDGLWTAINESAYERLLREDCVLVRYLPRAPSINRPVEAPGWNDPVGNKIGAFVLAALLLIFGVVPALQTIRVARKKCWELVDIDERSWTLARDQDELVVVEAKSIAGGKLLELPRTRAKMPWRYETDVLVLKRRGAPSLFIRVSKPLSAPLTRAFEVLQSRRVLRRKRQT